MTEARLDGPQLPKERQNFPSSVKVRIASHLSWESDLGVVVLTAPYIKTMLAVIWL